MFALFIYRLLLIILLPIVIIVLIIRSKNNKAYRQRILERLGFFPQPTSFQPVKKAGIIIHAASVGEVIALKPFVEQLLQTYPTLPITLTTFTPTGSAQVKKMFASRVQHGYLPLDVFPCTSLFLKRLQPKLIIFMETELWPNLVAQCAKKNIKLMIINGRLSQKSVMQYQKLSALISPTLNYFDKILTQSQENNEMFIKLKANTDKCEVSGNLKFDINIDQSIKEKQHELAELLPKNRVLWLVASTHDGDEEIILESFKEILSKFPELLLIIVPRHPERFSHVGDLCKSLHFTLTKRSSNTVVTHEQIWLLDSLGELMAAFSLANIVTMGGSFSHIGGHNPLEPALFKKPIIVGSDMSNFNHVLTQLKQHQGVIQLEGEGNQSQSIALTKAVLALLEKPDQQQRLGYNAYQVVLANQGASEYTLKHVKSLMSFSEKTTG